MDGNSIIKRETLVFRVFISSTFADFKAERNYLDKEVFPHLREFCQEHGTEFQPVDLRWGISEEASREMLAVELCKKELERCQQISPRPNFVILAGDRYGWCPPPHKISAVDWELLYEVLSADDKQILRDAYLPDQHAIPVEFVYVQQDGVHHQTIAEILQRASLKVFSEQEVRRIPYEASVTHQEIWAGAISPLTAREHVYLYQREFLDIPQTTKDASLHPYADFLPDGNLDVYKYARQTQLCHRLFEIIPTSSIHKASCSIQEWCSNSSLKDSMLKEFGQRVYSHLLAIISKEIQLWPEPDHRINETDKSAKILLTGAIERTEILESIEAMLIRNTGSPSFLVGRSGSGKSTLLAMLVQEHCHRGNSVLWIPIGVPQYDRNLLGLLNHVVSKLAEIIEANFESSDTIETVAIEFSRLVNLKSEHSLTIVIDGLDQLDEQFRAHELWWLPARTSKNTTIIASAAIDQYERTSLGQAIESRSTTINKLELGDLGVESAIAATDRWLSLCGRIVIGDQRQLTIRALRVNNSALYARLIGHVLSSQYSFAETYSFPDQTHKLFEMICNKWATDKEHGAAFVKAVLGYISLSHGGLSEGELLELLNLDDAVHDATNRRFQHAPNYEQLPFAIWSRLRSDLDPFLSESRTDKRLVLFHRQIRNAAVDWTFNDTASKLRVHSNLAKFFLLLGKTTFKSVGNDMHKSRFLSLAAYHAAESGDEVLIHSISESTIQSLMEKYLGAGRSQVILEDFCYRLAQTDPPNWEVISNCAKAFVERKERLAATRKASRGIPEYIYLGDYQAALTLAHTQEDKGKSICYLAMSEILLALGEEKKAEECKRLASSPYDDRLQLDLTRQEFLLSLLSTMPITQEVNQSNVSVKQDSSITYRPHEKTLFDFIIYTMLVMGSTIINSIIAFERLLYAFTFSLFGIFVFLYCGSLFKSVDTVGLNMNRNATIGCFFLALVVAFIRCIFQHIIGLIGLSFCNKLVNQIIRSNSTVEATLLCFILDSLNVDQTRRYVLNPQTAHELVVFSVRYPHPMLAARLLAHCSMALPWNSSLITAELRKVVANRQRMIIQSVFHISEITRLGVPIMHAVANCARFPETAEIVYRIYETLPLNISSLKKSITWFDYFSLSKTRNPKVPDYAYIIESIPRSLRAEILLLTKSFSPPVHRMCSFLFLTLPTAYWHTYKKSYLFEKVLLVVAAIIGIIVFQAYFITINFTVESINIYTLLICSLAIVLTSASAYNRWSGRRDHQFWLDKQDQQKPKRQNNSQYFIFANNKSPPWTWTDWFPCLCGITYFGLLFSVSNYSISGRQNYGRTLEEDLERYVADWEVLIRKYHRSIPRNKRAFAPPTYSFLGPKGVEDLVLARLIIQRGWKAAIAGPRFSDEAWTRVTKLLIRSDWLGQQAKFVADVLPSTPAVRAMINKTYLRAEKASDFQSLEERVLKDSARINDMQPQIFHRAVVALVSVMIAFGAIHPSITGIIKFPVSPMTDLGLLLWCYLNLIAACVFITPTKSWIMKIGFLVIGLFLSISIVELTGGLVKDHGLPFSTSQARGWAFAIVSTCSLSTLFYAPYTVAVVRGSMLLCPRPLQLLWQRFLGIVMIPAFSFALSLHLHFLVLLWHGTEKLLWDNRVAYMQFFGGFMQ